MSAIAWMTPPAIAIGFLLALVTAGAVGKATGFVEPVSRYPGIDGLRGYAATAVYFHHASQWLYRAQHWTAAQSPFAYNIGRVGVTLFFMTTAFLFFEKVVFGTQPVDWIRLSVGRVTRLTPMYLATIAVVFLIVGVSTGWTLREPAPTVLQQVLAWLTFTIPGNPAINGFGTEAILSGVTWTLPCEWFFYLLLPVIAFAFRRRVPWVPAALCAGAAIWIAVHNGMSRYASAIYLPFVVGVVVAGLVRLPAVARWRWLRNPWWMGLAVALCCVNRWERTVWVSVLSCGAVFWMIASGNTLWGALTQRSACFLGQISYSVYLTHGLFIYAFWTWIVGADGVPTVGPLAYSVWVGGGVVLLVAVSSLTFHCIERPGMRLTGSATRWARSRVHVWPA